MFDPLAEIKARPHRTMAQWERDLDWLIGEVENLRALGGGAAMIDPLLDTLKLLSGDEGIGHPPFSAIGWDAERKVLSFRRHHDEWVNLWLKELKDGLHIVERNNGPAAGTVILWAENRRTGPLLAVQGYGFHGGLLKRLRAAEALIDESPRWLLSAGADMSIEEAWAGKIREYRDG